jgi:hypothetical protein
MHHVRRIVLLAFLGLAAAVPPSQARIDEELADELQAMVDKSEKVHRPLLTNPKDSAQIRKAIAQEQQNMSRMKEIVQKYGWPGRSLVGEDGAKNAFLLVVQSNVDRDFQKACLKLMEKEAAKGEVDWKDVAFLTDQLRVLDGRKQLYGTQVKINKGKVTFHSIEDEKNVDKRRKEIGLPPLAEFKKQLEDSLKMQNP